jgi:hypothetical protein
MLVGYQLCPRHLLNVRVKDVVSSANWQCAAVAKGLPRGKPSAVQLKEEREVDARLNKETIVTGRQESFFFFRLRLAISGRDK